MHEGWLIKSPPFKKIWHAKWRKRWFILVHGDIPGQFLLKYFKDQTCQKQKGTIDLNLCEQVDAGLRKSKLQYVFNIKTSKRTYFLAANTEKELNNWVHCICHVCGLHELNDQNFIDLLKATQSNVANTSSEPLLNKTFRENSNLSNQTNNSSCSTDTTNVSDITGSIVKVTDSQSDESKVYVNYPECMNKENNFTLNNDNASLQSNGHRRATKTVPGNLNFNDCGISYQDDMKPISPYIAISDCFSGSPTYMNHQIITNENLQNQLIGQNNIAIDQLYSPKRINYAKPDESEPTSDQSGSTDSDNAFSDRDSLSKQFMGETPEKDRRSTGSEQNDMDLSFIQHFSRLNSKYSDAVPVMPSPSLALNSQTPARSLDYQNLKTESPKFLTESDITAQSTPFINNYENLINANPLSTNSVADEGRIFRYDFIEQPPVDRTRKPKVPSNQPIKSAPSSPSTKVPPNVDRKLKPAVEQASKVDEKLQYIDLMHTASAELRSPDVIPTISSSTGSIDALVNATEHDVVDASNAVSQKNGKTVYKTIDFIKTDAFKRTREDIETTRRKMSES